MVRPIQQKQQVTQSKGPNQPIAKKTVAESEVSPAEMLKKIEAVRRQQRKNWVIINREHPLFKDWILGQLMGLCRDERIGCRIGNYRMGDARFQGLKVMLIDPDCDTENNAEGCVESLFDGYYEHQWLPLGIGYQIITVSPEKTKGGAEAVLIPAVSKGIVETLKGIKGLRKKIISTESETDINKALQQVNIKSTEEVSRWSEFAATRPLERDFIIAQTVHLCLDNNMECKTNSTVDLFGEPFYTLDVSFVDEDADPDDYPGAAVEALLDELSEEKRIPFNFRYQLIDARINPETNQIEGSIMPVPPEDWQSLFSSDD